MCIDDNNNDDEEEEDEEEDANNTDNDDVPDGIDNGNVTLVFSLSSFGFSNKLSYHSIIIHK